MSESPITGCQKCGQNVTSSGGCHCREDKPIQAHSLSEYKRLDAMGVEVEKPHWTILDALQAAYKKHVRGDDSIGWDELGFKLSDALCNLMGNDEFIKWTKDDN